MKRITMQELAENESEVSHDIWQNDETYRICDSDGKDFASVTLNTTERIPETLDSKAKLPELIVQVDNAAAVGW